MALELWWGSGSPYSWRALLALEHKRLPYVSHLVQFSKQEHRSPQMLQMNPRGRVPVLVFAGLSPFTQEGELKGELPLGLVVLKAGANRGGQELVAELVDLVRQRIGPVACFKQAVVVKRLPKTRSGKIVRGTIRKIADGVAYTVPPTIDDPLILDEITADLAANGYPLNRT